MTRTGNRVVRGVLRNVMCALCAALCAAPLPALAYVGPGLGGGAVAATLGIAAALFMLLAGVVWYPLKKLFNRLRPKKSRKS